MRRFIDWLYALDRRVIIFIIILCLLSIPISIYIIVKRIEDFRKDPVRSQEDLNINMKVEGINLVPGLFIDSNGNVGIGTSTPAALLNVNGDTNVVGNLILNSDLIVTEGNAPDYNTILVNGPNSSQIRLSNGNITILNSSAETALSIDNSALINSGTNPIKINDKYDNYSISGRTERAQITNIANTSDVDSGLYIFGNRNANGSRRLVFVSDRLIVKTQLQFIYRDNSPSCDNSFVGGVLLYPKDGYYQLYFCQGGDGNSDRWRILSTEKGEASDYAEYYQIDDISIEKGDIVSISNNWKVEKSSNSEKLIGIVSTEPADILGTHDDAIAPGKNTIDVMAERGYRPVALSGRVPVKIMIKNDSIAAGDPITVSEFQGIGIKAMLSTEIVGKTLESFNPDINKCLSVNNPSEIQWEKEQTQTWATTGTCYKLPDGTIFGKVMVFVNVGWYQDKKEVEDLKSEVENLKELVCEIRGNC